ncbi:GntR family transcriptional regulator [Lichenifustis flavocetrariae]|uniref:GntR family transcriptional regulator n=1 Tax=Lichenifustis flavocetrariae TaxID=2949735 RepID=A0AA42CMD0_9HYPH|nr:GntR family transcriptional regulator [Lichenifustis flavocetrariae]MCW6508225.1 GntR family transcriptional regulator [Lichenifustis flavocetrariae]
MDVLESLAPERSPDRGKRPSNRVTTICRAIQTAIAEQRLMPGTRLSEDQLGGIFGASRTLVRAALQSLARDGVVVLTRNKGAAVARPTVEDARALFEARRIIEAATVSRAALRVTAADIATLEALVKRGRDALDTQDRGRAIRMSGEFHLAIARMAKQPVLHEFLSELVARSSLVIALYGHSAHSECGDAEHAGLIDILRNRDPALATATMIRHLDHIEADLDLVQQPPEARPLSDILRASSGAD